MRVLALALLLAACAASPPSEPICAGTTCMDRLWLRLAMERLVPLPEAVGWQGEMEREIDAELEARRGAAGSCGRWSGGRQL